MGQKEEEYNKIAYDLWIKMQPQIKKIAAKVILFNNHLSMDDYMSEAFIACQKAVKKYRNSGRGKMKLRVYAFWHILKAIHKMADTGGVVYKVYSPDDTYIKTVSNGEYRKLKKELKNKGYTFRSTQLLEKLDDNV
jgi:DNA-directed RNA polymerase sigma subunit (sigma70/sigma32)